MRTLAANSPVTAGILVVDDAPANLELLSQMLRERGYEPRPVTSGKQALLAAQADPPDLVLLDIKMPEMDGYEVCERLKANPQLRDIPIIFLSAFAETMDKVKAFSLGAVDYVTKPFQMDEIEVRVRTHLALRSLQLQLSRQNERLEHLLEEQRRADELLRQQNETLQRMLLANDHERRLIAYEIHDTLAQQIAAAALHLQAFAMRREAKPQAADEAFAEGLRILQESQLEIRRLIRGVRPLTIEESGVVAVLTQLIQDWADKPGPRLEFHHAVHFDRLTPLLENAIFRIVQEGVTNARKYSQSERVRIELTQQADEVWIVVQDWGIGFHAAALGPTTFGLEGIRERSRWLGGQAAITSEPGAGTRISVRLPLLPRGEGD